MTEELETEDAVKRVALLSGVMRLFSHKKERERRSR